MNYYNEIKRELIDNELNKKVKDYSKNKYEIQKYYNVGKLLSEAGNNYGEAIIKEYSKKLTNEIGKKYSVRYLFDMRKLYLFSKVHPLGAQLTMSHYRLLFPLNDNNEIVLSSNQTLFIDCGTVVIAIGQSPNPLIRQTTPGLDCQKWGGIIVEEETNHTSKEGVWAGGDVVTGAATVILAMGAGKKAAKAIDEKLSGE